MRIIPVQTAETIMRRDSERNYWQTSLELWVHGHGEGSKMTEVRAMGTEGVRFAVGRQCAPVLAGVKPSNLLIMEKGHEELLGWELKGTRLARCLLYTSQRKDYWLLFEPAKVKAVMGDPQNESFLLSQGYERSLSLAGMLLQFRSRFAGYKEGRDGFPHEMGLLLGYPLKDVLGFIEHEGRDFKLSGYWKVYDDVDYAQAIFELYQYAKQAVLQLCRQGAELSDICRVCRENIQA